MADIKTHLNICQKDTSDLKTSLEFSHKDIDELKPCKSKRDEIKADIDDVNNSIHYHIDKLKYLGNQIKVEEITSE